MPSKINSHIGMICSFKKMFKFLISPVVSVPKRQIFTIILIHLACWYAVSEGEDYYLQPGDVLQISVFNEPELARELRISESFDIIFPLIGKLNAQNLTAQDLNVKLTESLNEYLVDPQITIFIKEFSKIYVYGSVVKPGEYQLFQPLTLLKAISLAGGLSEHANGKKVKIMRKVKDEEVTIFIDLQEITEKGYQSKDPKLNPGDIIVVPESFL